MTPECLEDIGQDLELLATTQGREAVGLAAGTLTGDIRDIIEQLLLGFNVAID
jgi:hypothetical protein